MSQIRFALVEDEHQQPIVINVNKVVKITPLPIGGCEIFFDAFEKGDYPVTIQVRENHSDLMDLFNR